MQKKTNNIEYPVNTAVTEERNEETKNKNKLKELLEHFRVLEIDRRAVLSIFKILIGIIYLLDTEIKEEEEGASFQKRV